MVDMGNDGDIADIHLGCSAGARGLYRADFGAATAGGTIAKRSGGSRSAARAGRAAEDRDTPLSGRRSRSGRASGLTASVLGTGRGVPSADCLDVLARWLGARAGADEAVSAILAAAQSGSRDSGAGLRDIAGGARKHSSSSRGLDLQDLRQSGAPAAAA